MSHFASQDYAGDQTGEGSEQCSGKGIPGPGDFCGYKVKTHGVEDCLGAGHADGSRKTDERIGSIFFIQVQKEACGGGRGEHFYQGKGNQFSGETDTAGKLSDPGGQGVQESGGLQYAGGDHQAYQRRQNFHDGKKAVSGAFYEGIVDLDLAQETVSDDRKNDQGNDEIRQV